jgi:ferrous-iron efflux pump FieF
MQRPQPISKKEATKKRQVILLSVATAGTLTIFKLIVGFASHSLAVLASAFDSLMDVLVSSVNFLAMKEADKPADAEHLYGHGKIESLAGLFQSLLISASGLFLAFEAARRMIHGSSLEFIPIAIGVMLVSMVLTLLLVLRLRKVLAQTRSIIVGTETLHYKTDLLSGGGVVLALILVRVTNSPIWDLVVAIAIAGYILKNSFTILKNSVDELLDRALPPEEQKRIEELILTYHQKVVGVHNLRTRKIGQRRFIDFHFEIRGEEDFARAHGLAEGLVAKLQEEFPGADVTVHFDPEGADDQLRL